MDLTAIYNAFDADEPLPPGDDERYVDFSKVRGDSQVAKRLVQRVKNAPNNQSHHLLMGHTKCGKTTELNRAAHLLEQNGYVTVFFDVAEFATRTFEYTAVLLLMAQQVVAQLAAKYEIKVKSESIQKLAEFLREQEVTVGKELSGEATAKSEAEIGSGLLASFLGKLGFGVELSGSFQRSREITTKIEADARGFIEAICALIDEACRKVLTTTGKKGLVIICDGCDKLAINATDGSGKSHDLQQYLFIDHANDLQSVPCHVIYTVPLSIAINLGDIWEQSTEFVPAIPVSLLPGVSKSYVLEGRKCLLEVMNRRLHQQNASIDGLFVDPNWIYQLLDVSGGHLSDLLLLVREAVLEAQTDGAERIDQVHINRSIRSRALEYSRLIESDYLEVLSNIDHYKNRQAKSKAYQEVIFKRLALEYRGDECDGGVDDVIVDLHPLVVASKSYRRHKESKSQ